MTYLCFIATIILSISLSYGAFIPNNEESSLTQDGKENVYLRPILLKSESGVNSEGCFNEIGGSQLFPDYENLERGVSHHQIHKRYLNSKDALNKNKFKHNKLHTIGLFGEGKHHGVSKNKLEPSNIFDAGVRLSKVRGEAHKNMRDFVDKIVLNDKLNLDEPDAFSRFHTGGLRTPNDTTKIRSKINFLDDNMHKFGEDELESYINNENKKKFCDTDIYFIDKRNDGNIINAYSVESNDDKNSFKREVSEDSNFSNDTSGIKNEIDKVYKDISENVRLLSKLRDRESHLLKRPSSKRWVIVDNTIGDIMNSNRGRRCSQELTVEMDTDKDTSPDRLEHIERKVDEEVLQVNVPLKCNNNH